MDSAEQPERTRSTWGWLAVLAPSGPPLRAFRLLKQPVWALPGARMAN